MENSPTLLHETKEFHESQRGKVFVIGDLDGSYNSYKRTLFKLGLIDDTRKWIGGEQNLIFLGDILADRQRGGLRILRHIHELRPQIVERGGSIEVLAGNHEWFMINVLLWIKCMAMFRSGDNNKTMTSTERARTITNYLSQSFYYKHTRGLYELFKIGGDEKEISKLFQNQGDEKEVSTMMKDKNWEFIREEICAMKLLSIKENTIFFHTPPTQGMLDILLKQYTSTHKNQDQLINAINAINTQWQYFLRVSFDYKVEEIPDWADEYIDSYGDMAETFLATENGTIDAYKKRVGTNEEVNQERITPTHHKMYEILINNGITCICHGHDNDVPRIPGFRVVSMNRRYGTNLDKVGISGLLYNIHNKIIDTLSQTTER